MTTRRRKRSQMEMDRRAMFLDGGDRKSWDHCSDLERFVRQLCVDDLLALGLLLPSDLEMYCPPALEAQTAPDEVGAAPCT